MVPGLLLPPEPWVVPVPHKTAPSHDGVEAATAGETPRLTPPTPTVTKPVTKNATTSSVRNVNQPACRRRRGRFWWWCGDVMSQDSLSCLSIDTSNLLPHPTITYSGWYYLVADAEDDGDVDGLGVVGMMVMWLKLMSSAVVVHESMSHGRVAGVPGINVKWTVTARRAS